MPSIEAHMDEVGARWVDALRSYEGNAPLRTEVEALTAAFFARYPGIQRTPRAEQFIAGLALDRSLSLPADSSAPTQTQNAA